MLQCEYIGILRPVFSGTCTVTYIKTGGPESFYTGSYTAAIHIAS